MVAWAVKAGDGEPIAVPMSMDIFAILLVDDVAVFVAWLLLPDADDDALSLINRLPPVHGRDNRNVNNVLASLFSCTNCLDF